MLHLTDPLSDNLAGNVVGQLIGQAARFYLFRRYVFRTPVTVGEFMHLPPHGQHNERMTEPDPAPGTARRLGG